MWDCTSPARWSKQVLSTTLLGAPALCRTLLPPLKAEPLLPRDAQEVPCVAWVGNA